MRNKPPEHSVMKNCCIVARDATPYIFSFLAPGEGDAIVNLDAFLIIPIEKISNFNKIKKWGGTFRLVKTRAMTGEKSK